MKIYFKLFLVLVFLLIVSECFSQEPENIKTPQTENFIKYGNTPVSYYTGTLSLSVPLYTYEDNDFKIPISIGYNSTGFRPNVQSSIIGLNWHLTAGGVITREIQGEADDHLRNSTDAASFNGLLCGVRNKTYDMEEIWSYDVGLTYNNSCLLGESLENSYEGEPDIFFFNFMGYQGRFVIGLDGKVKNVSGATPLKIDITNLKIQSEGQPIPLDSEIAITTEDGTKYVFGGSVEYLEYNQPCLSYHYRSNVSPRISSWYLKSIVKLNESKVDFEYLPFTNNIEFGINVIESSSDPSDEIDDRTHIVTNTHVRHTYTMTDLEVDPDDPAGWVECEATSANTSVEPSYSFIKTVYLSKISVNDVVVAEFKYSKKENCFYERQTINKEYRPLKLNSILIPDFRSIKFNQEYLGGDSKRMFLTSLSIVGDYRKNFVTDLSKTDQKKYTFSYKKTDKITDPQTRNIDHWGFSNGETNLYANLLPSVTFDENSDIIDMSTERAPDTTLRDVGLLEKIVYPTGGYSKFEYSGHDYSHRLERHSSSDFLPSLREVAGIAGGARITKIIDFDGKSDTNVREFKYVENYVEDNSDTSSGILLDWPRYVFVWTINGGDYERIDIRGEGAGFHKNYIGENYITYSEVTEVLNNESFITRKYTSYKTNPDLVNHGNVYVTNRNMFDIIDQKELYTNFYGIKLGNVSFERGKLKQETFYNQDKNKVLENTYEYLTPDSLAKTFADRSIADRNFTVGMIPNTGACSATYKIFLYNNKTERKVSKVYPISKNGSATVVGADCVKTEQIYRYNEFDQISLDSTHTSSGDNLSIEYKYPLDFTDDPNDFAGLDNEAKAIKRLIDDNNIGSPYEIIEKRNGNIISASLTDYKIENDLVLPYHTYSLSAKPNRDDSQLSYAEIGGETVPSLFNFEKHPDYQTSVTYDKYNNKGRIQQYRKAENIPITILWGYNNRYVIAKIENLEYSVIENNSMFQGYINELGEFNLISNNKDELRTLNDSIRNILPDSCFITTYTYDPLVGMTSKTDTNGITTYYEYDQFGRLRFTKNADGDILQSNSYKHKYSLPD